MEKTIKEFSDELGLSKQTIQKVIEKMDSDKKPVKRGNRYILSLQNQIDIQFFLGLKTDISDIETDNSDKESNISDINSNKTNKTDIETNKTDIETNNLDKNKYIDFLSSQLESKDEQIEKLQKLLDQQQILTLQANKKIEQLETELEKEDEPDRSKEEKAEELKKTNEKKGFWQKFFSK
ncbi:DUF536 domain-containing protein [Enterococcus faecalis]|uniref:DUF536 domain-containing protein n=1 Tax=Enterococcus faecalis TaxID=1351 RepID=UPI003DA169B1